MYMAKKFTSKLNPNCDRLWWTHFQKMMRVGISVGPLHATLFSGVATIDATTHLRAQTNQQKILLHFVAKLQINL